MKEIEIKFLKVNLTDLKRRLKRLGAKRVFAPKLFQEVHLNHPDLAKRYYSLFRLRQEGKDLVLAIKNGRRGGRFKIEEEHEVRMDSTLGDALKFLKALGFYVTKHREKLREEYRLGGVKIEMDRYPGMDPYVELEGPSKKDLQAVAGKLGFDLKNASTDTAGAVIEKAGLDPAMLLFKERNGRPSGLAGRIKTRTPSRR